jgi:hypothetical protein
MPEGGKKFDGSKPQMDLLNTTALIEIAKVMSFGANKYGRFNWRKGLEWSRVISACDRHMKAFNDGQDLDPETGISHVAHAACNLMMLLQYIQSHPHLDDRYKEDAQAEGTERAGVSTSPDKEAGESQWEAQTSARESLQRYTTSGTTQHGFFNVRSPGGTNQ